MLILVLKRGAPLKNTQENIRKQNVRIPQCQKKDCPWVFLFGPGHIRLFLGGFRPRGFRARGQGRIGPHSELLILAPQWAFSGRMSRVLGYLEGGRVMFPSLALTDH